MENDEAKWRVCTILKLSKEQYPQKWLTSRELAYYTGIPRNSLRSIIARWFRYRWPYIQRQQLDFNCWGYYIGSRGLTFLVSAPRFLDVAKFEARLIEYQVSAGIIEAPVKEVIPLQPIEPIEEHISKPAESQIESIQSEQLVKCSGCGHEFHPECFKDGFCYDCTQLLNAEDARKPDKFGLYHCNQCGQKVYLEGIDLSTGLCLKCEAVTAQKEG